MPLGAALITGGLGILGGLFGDSGDRDVAQIAADRDLRTTSLEELFSESFLSSLSIAERESLEQSVSTGTAQTISDLLSQEQVTTSETGRVSGTETVVGTGTTTDTGVTTTAAGTTVQRGSAGAAQALQDIIQGGSQPSGSAAIQASIDRVLRSGAPVVAGAGSRAGAFDSTVQAQLANDLIVKAAEAGALTELQQENVNTQTLLAAIASSQAGEEAVQTAEDTTTATTGTSQTAQDTTSEQFNINQLNAITDLIQQQQQQQQTAQQSTTSQQEVTAETVDQTQTQQQVSESDVFQDVSFEGANAGGIDRGILGQSGIRAGGAPSGPSLVPPGNANDLNAALGLPLVGPGLGAGAAGTNLGLVGPTPTGIAAPQGPLTQVGPPPSTLTPFGTGDVIGPTEGPARLGPSRLDATQGPLSQVGPPPSSTVSTQNNNLVENLFEPDILQRLLNSPRGQLF